MKEKIAELMEHAYIEYIDPVSHDIYYNFSSEKFAELIIEECFNVVNNFALQQAEKPENILGENLQISMKITDSAYKIKEHFGFD
jgi:hypothetical protein